MGFDNFAKMMQTLIKQREKDHQIYATNEHLTTITTNCSHLKQEQSTKIDVRLADTEQLSKEHSENGVQALTTKMLNQAIASFEPRTWKMQGLRFLNMLHRRWNRRKRCI
jgi:hypothetical protein